MSDKIKAYILDLDGVITDTAEFHFKAWKKMADEEGIPFGREDNEKLRGVSRRKSMELILNGREMEESKIQKLMDRKNEYYNDFLNNLSEGDLLPGARDLIDEIISRGYKIAVASSSRNAKTVLKNLGIMDIFDTISDGHSVENSKPAPDLFLHTAEKLDLSPKDCVVIEDAESGIKGALAANMVAVGVGPEDRLGKAHYRYDTVKDINLDEIIK